MNVIRLVLIGFVLLPQSFTVMAEGEFYETKKDIVKALKGENNLGKKRSMFGGANKTRAIKRKKTVMVMREDKQSGKHSKVTYTTGDETGSANMRIEFDLNSARIRKTSHGLLNELGKALNDKDLADKKLIIAGHTDSQGNGEYNMKLSVQRAHAVRFYLNKHFAIHKRRLEVIGFGESNPLVSNANHVNRQMNRRVEIIHGAQ